MKHKINFSILLSAILLINTLHCMASPKREMRAVWIASVVNIDWPSQSGLSSEEQQRELIELLDLAKAFHMNAVILQIRPVTDAFFPSPYEPWSQYLTGVQGQAPDPYYDPLAFAIEECRKRGLEIHLWLNPYRAEMDTARKALAENHPVNTRPELFVTYGNTRYFNPGLPETREHVTRVVADLVRRYDMDAIHFDDYFYPYRIGDLEFPDSAAFAMHPGNFLPEQKDDWRRHNVDLIIRMLQDTIKSIKPHVEFGISPFGVWRNIADDPTGSDTRAGVTNYDDLYADILKWQQLRWIDYVTPQLYWYIGMEAADYAILADWWSKNTFGCPLYIGQGLYRLTPDNPNRVWRSSREIIRQLNIIRETPNIDGSMFFSARSLRSNPFRLQQRLLRGPYQHLALPPVNNRVKQIGAEPPANAQIRTVGNQIILSWEAGLNNKAFVIYRFRKGRAANTEEAENIFHITGENVVHFESTRRTSLNRYYYMISATSPTNQESVPVFFEKVQGFENP